MAFWRFPIILAIACGIALCCTAPAFGQGYFGQNKVQYTHFDWHVLATTHFNIYYYSVERELAEIAARSAEEAYRVLAPRFDMEIYDKIPLIIYSNPNHFVQTNVTPELLPENVAGFTEFIKGRVVVPFSGSYHDFDHVIRHELVHVFTLAKIDRIAREYEKSSIAFPPLWFMEGLAEYWSREWDSEADLIVRDMVINGNQPSIDDMWTVNGTFFMYKLGESICKFINDHYGADKLTRLFDNWYINRNFEALLAYTLGDDIRTLSDKWSYDLKKKYFPQISRLEIPDRDGQRLTRRQFAVRPVPVTLKDKNGQDEQWVIYKANRQGYSAIYMIPADGNQKRVVTLLKGERSSRFESLHLMTSGVDQYDNRLLIFSSKSKEKDVLYLYDLEKRGIVRRYEFSEVESIASPRFSPDGKSVVFSGNHISGYSDIYALNLASGALLRLTNDIYQDVDPCFGSDGRSVIFSSDRGAEGYDGYLSLYRLSLDSGKITRLTYGNFSDRGPSESPDGSKIIFSSDRGDESAFNIFVLDSSGLSQATKYITGAFDPRFGAKAGEIYFTAYQDRGFHVFKRTLTTEAPLSAGTIPHTDGVWTPGKISGAASSASAKYHTKYTLDIAQSIISYDEVYGSIGGAQAAISDVLGNNTFIFLLANTAQTNDEILSSFNVAVTYLRRTSRLNWGVSAFHLYDQFYNPHDSYYYERLLGGAFYASYPISRFARLETSSFMRVSDKDFNFGFNRRHAILGTQLLSYVTDNSLWEYTGPIDGRRLNLTVGYTYDFNSSRAFNRLGSADLRHYFRLGRLSCFASRFFAFSSSGVEPQRIYLGGSWSFRGYDRRELYTRNVLFNSEELRFPLFNKVVLGFPFGDFRIGGIQGALFHDTGTAWEDQWQSWRGSFGASVRFALGYLVVLRLDFSRTHDFHTISPHTRTDFFFGWNF